MTEKVFLADNNTATLVCPECGTSKTVDVSKYKPLDKAVRLKIKCSCGNTYSPTLERREHYRKETNFPGQYINTLPGGEQEKGTVTVTDISRTGLRIKFKVEPNFRVGTRFVVEFRLDDKERTLVRKEVIIRRISGLVISAEFCSVSSISSSDPNDRAIGFYLFQ